MLGYSHAGERVRVVLTHSADDLLTIVSLALDTAVVAGKTAKCGSGLKRSKRGDPMFLQDLLTYKVMKLDIEYIQRLGSLCFVRKDKNLIILGAPGTEKIWTRKAMATNACQK